MAINNPPPYYLAKMHYLKRYYYISKKDLAMAIRQLDSCIALLQNHTIDERSNDLYALALFDAGDFSFRLKNYDAALHYFSAGKSFLLASGKDSCGLYLYYHSMANILFAQQKYLQAAIFFKLKCRWVSCSGIPGDKYGEYLNVQENLDNTGMCYQRAGLTDSALYFYNSTLRYISQNVKVFDTNSVRDADFIAHRAVVYRNLAEIYFQQGNLKDAELFFLKCLANTQRLDTSFTLPAKLSLADVYLHNNKIQEARDTLESVARVLDTGKINTSSENLHKLFSGYYLKKGQLISANAALLKAYSIRDSIETRDQQFNATDVGKEFEIRENAIHNETLRKDNAIKNTYLFAAIAGGILAFLLAITIWQNLSGKSRYASKLSLLTSEANRQNTELKRTLASLEQSQAENNRIIRVVAHDLKNPVSAIRTLTYSLRKKQNDSNKEVFGFIETACSDAVKLINDLLNNRKSLHTISKELVDMGRLIEQSAALYQDRVAEKNLMLHLQMVQAVLLLNRPKMLEAINNIIGNMIALSHENAVLNIQLEKTENSVLLKLYRNMPAENTFIPAAHNANADEITAELAVSKQIIEDHNGRLWFKKEAPNHSSFYVELPLSES